jgi:hypothetical protein
MNEVVERGHRVWPVARERRQVVRPREDVHRIDLDRSKAFGGRADVRRTGSARLRDTESK